MKALILGGTGFIGSNVAQKLAQLNYDVLVYSPSASIYSFTEKIKYTTGFLADTEKIKKHTQWADVIFHFVSTTTPKTSMDDHYHDLTSNLLPFVQLLEILREYRHKKLIFCSSGGAVYGKTSNMPIAETKIKQPSTSYGLVKSAMEEYASYYQSKYEIPCLILRPANIYGPKTRSIGEQGIISTLVYNTVYDKPTKFWVPLTNTRDYVYIDDFVQAVICLLEQKADGVFNIGSGTGFTLAEIIDTVAFCTGKTLPMEMAEQLIEDEGVNILDNSKIYSITGWVPKTSLTYGIAQVYENMTSKLKTLTPLV